MIDYLNNSESSTWHTNPWCQLTNHFYNIMLHNRAFFHQFPPIITSRYSIPVSIFTRILGLFQDFWLANFNGKIITYYNCSLTILDYVIWKIGFMIIFWQIELWIIERHLFIFTKNSTKIERLCSVSILFVEYFNTFSLFKTSFLSLSFGIQAGIDSEKMQDEETF